MSWLKNLFSGSTLQTMDEIELEDITKDTEAESRSIKVISKLAKYMLDEKTTNRFERCLLFHIFTLDNMIDMYKEDYGYPTLEDLQSYFTTYIGDNLSDIYQVTNYIHSDHSIYMGIYEFAKFLITADALLLYNNDDTENVYSIAESKDSIKLMIINDDYNIGYYFTKQLTTDKNRNILEEYIDGDANDSMVGFVEVKRNNGSKTKTNFGFDMTGNFKSGSYKDSVLFNILINNTRDIITSTYTTILNRSYPTYIGTKVDNFNLMEYLHGFRIRNTTTE